MGMTRAIGAALLGAVLGFTGAQFGATPALAQSQFAPVLYVNDRAITSFELDQRRRLLELFGEPGDLTQTARQQLIDDRIRLFAAARDGIRVTDEQITAGIEEFAGRANLTGPELLNVIGQAGVQRESFEDFIRAGQSWREVVRVRFGPRAQVTEAEVDRAIANAAGRGSVPGTLAIEFAQYVPPSRDAGRLDSILSQIDTCDDLYGVAQGQPEEALTFSTLPPDQIPAELRTALDQLDEGEVSTLNRESGPVLLMMCGRTIAFEDGINRGAVRGQLVNRRIASYADGYLAELRADAIIREQ